MGKCGVVCSGCRGVWVWRVWVCENVTGDGCVLCGCN